MPLEEVTLDQNEDEGGHYHPEEAEEQLKNGSSGDQKHEADNKQRDTTRSKSPPPSADGKSSRKEIECKVFLLNGEVMTVSVDVSPNRNWLFIIGYPLKCLHLCVCVFFFVLEKNKDS